MPLICDEIQSGIGRTGRWFAFEHEGIVPDVVVLSKAIGGIGMPLSVVVYHERLDVWKPGAHMGTFRGNQPAMVAGAAAIELMEGLRLVERAAELGDSLLAGLRRAFGSSALVANVRGRGLMIGVELASSALALAVREACLARGLIIELGGRGDRVLRFLPPLVLSRRLAARIVEIVTDALDDAIVNSD